MANLSSKIQGVSQAAVPIVNASTTYTPTLNTGALGSGGTVVGTYSRVGEFLELHIELTQSAAGTAGSGTYTLTLPTGLTIDTRNMPSSDAFRNIFGSAGLRTTNGYYLGTVEYWTSTTLGFSFVNDATGVFNWGSANQALSLATVQMSAQARIPIQEWAGSGTQQTANTYQVEYAYNSDTSDADNATAFAYGAGGTQYGSFSTATRTKTVRFRQAIQPTDVVVYEHWDTNGWTEWGFVQSLSATTGAAIKVINSTDVEVYFGSAGYPASTRTGAAAWSAIAASSNHKWRLRKVSGGIQGFGNATTTTPGLVTLAQLTPVQYLGNLAFTPSAGFTPTQARFDAWRYGNTMRVHGYFNAGASGPTTASIALPTGYTIDRSVLSANASGTMLGIYVQPTTSGTAAAVFNTSTGSQGVLFFDGSDTARMYVAVSAQSNAYLKATGSAIVTQNAAFDFWVDIPIAEWAGSLPGLVSDSQVEFASNDGSGGTAAGTAYDTGMVTGSSGSLYVAVNASTVTGNSRTRYRVRFATAIQATDQLVFETTDGGTTFFPHHSREVQTNRQGAADYGVTIEAISGSSTDVYVAFGNGGRSALGNNYGLAGGTWGAISADALYKWRVKKIKSSISALVDNATATTGGLLLPVTSMANDLATTLGYKAYSHGGSYSGGLAPTVTLTAGGGTLTTVNQADFIPYKMQDGTWRCKLNITVVLSSASRSGATLSIAGLTFYTVPGGGDGQAVSGGGVFSANNGYSYAASGASTIVTSSGVTTTTTEYWFAGDVRLASKPTWAY